MLRNPLKSDEPDFKQKKPKQKTGRFRTWAFGAAKAVGKGPDGAFSAISSLFKLFEYFLGLLDLGNAALAVIDL